MPSPNFSPGSIKCVNKVFHKILNKVAHKIVIKCFLQPSTICSDRKKSHSHVTCYITVCLGKKALGKSKCTDPGLSHPFYFKALAIIVLIIPSMWCKHVTWKCETVIHKI